MSIWTRVSQLRRKGVILALPLAAVALPLAFAQTAAADTVYTPTTAAQLTGDISAANSAGGFNIIELPNTGLSPTTPITITGHLEITGAPMGTDTIGHNYEINGGAVVPLDTSDTITIAPGANVILKAFDLQNCGSQENEAVTLACVRVDDGGNVELDNMAILGAVDDGLIVNAGGTATLNDASIFNGLVNGIVLAAPSSGAIASATLNNATIAYNGADGIFTNQGDDLTLDNSVVAYSNQLDSDFQDCSDDAKIGPLPSSAKPTVIDSMDDDGTCDVTYSDDSYVNLGGATMGQGPSQFLMPGGPGNDSDGSGQSDLQDAGNPLTCLPDDQTFYKRDTATCDIGAVQTPADGETPDTDTAGPVCTVQYTHESTDPSVPSAMQVTAQSSDPGLGPDAITNAVIDLKSSPTTPNGTVSWPVVPGTLFDETNPTSTTLSASGSPLELDEVSAAAFPVTAQKPAGDTTAHDTEWEFDATDWLGNTTLCN